MAVEKMVMVTVGGCLENLDDFIIHCCLDGHVQAEPAMNHISKSMHFQALNEENKYADRLATVNELAHAFGGELEPIEEGCFIQDDEATDQEYLTKLSNDIQDMHNRRAEADAQIQQCKMAINSLSHFLEMDIALNEIIDCKFIKFRFGHLPKQSLEKLDLLKNNPYLLFFPCSYDNNDAWGVYFAPLEQAVDIDRIFASLYFERLRIPNSYETPDKAIEGYRQELAKLEKEREKIEASLHAIWVDEEKSCDLLYTRLVSGNAIHDIRSNVATYHDSFCFIGWVPRSELGWFKKAVLDVDGVDWEDEPAEELDDTYQPPTKLRNNKLMRPFETFIEMYGVPNYREFDPTTVFGILYTIIFGVMFADVGQGFVVALGGFLLGKLKNSDLGRIFTRCGISSMVFGVVFGSVFGFEDALNWFYQLIGLAEKPVSILDSALGVILMGIYMGVGLIYFFMCLNLYKCIRQKRYGRAVFSESGLAGMITYTGGVVLIAQFLNKNLQFLPTKVCVGLLAAGLILLFCKEWLISKIDKEPLEFDGAGDYIVTNLVELLEYVISYFTNTLSFLRVGSFVMVHAVMMNVVFTLAPAPENNIFAFVLVVILGNVIVASLECLLTYIQVLRLGFYEMFSRFYEGDGEAFHAIRLSDKLRKRGFSSAGQE